MSLLIKPSLSLPLFLELRIGLGNIVHHCDQLVYKTQQRHVDILAHGVNVQGEVDL